MPKVSIIIPVYNEKKFIKNCLSCCINQTLEDIEIIVVDDKSTDNTVEIVKDIMEEDSRIRLIELDKNYRQGYARNIAIEQATADYIMFLDADDLYEKNCVEEMYNKIIGDDADMSICKFATIDDRTGKISYQKYETGNYAYLPEKFHSGFCYKDVDFMDLFNKCNVVWDKIYRKSFLVENNIKFPGGMFCEDDVFSFETIFKAKKVSILNKSLLYYRINRPTSSSMLKDRTTFDCFKMFKMVKENLQREEIFFKLEKAFMYYHIYSFLFFYGNVNKRYKREFFYKMQKELSIYEGFIDDSYNKKNDPCTYNKLYFILKNNFFMYEFKKFLHKYKIPKIKITFVKEDYFIFFFSLFFLGKIM